jgi:small subunit ribosomal protein S7
MPRKFKSTEQFMKPDPRYGSLLLAKFINSVMKSGEKATAQKQVYAALDIMAERLPGEDPIKVFTEAINNVKPHVEVKSKRVGGATYQVPIEVSRKRQQSLAFRWILEVARKSRRGRTFAATLADELLAGFRKEGGAYTKRENTHKMADANKAFSHFAW